MKRDVGYALIAALSLSALAALWALVKAPELADPKGPDRALGPSGSLPLLPQALDNSKAIQQATAVLETRDLFRAAAPADMATLNRLSAARIAPPVELVPVEATPRRSAVAQSPSPAPVYRPTPPRTAPVISQTVLPAPRTLPPPVPAPSLAQTNPAPLPPSSTSQQVVIARGGGFPLTLRGVFPDARTGGRAHVALPNGRVVSTGPGGVIEGYQVVQINAASIIVQGRGGPRLRLEMPGY